MIDSALRTLLAADGTVAGMVGSYIYPGDIPQEVGFDRAIAFSKISVTDREIAHDGPIPTARTNFQFDCLSKETGSFTKEIGAKQLAAAVIDCLHGYRGTVAGETILETRVTGETDVGTADTQYFQVSLDVEIVHRE